MDNARDFVEMLRARVSGDETTRTPKGAIVDWRSEDIETRNGKFGVRVRTIVRGPDGQHHIFMFTITEPV